MRIALKSAVVLITTLAAPAAFPAKHPPRNGFRMPSGTIQCNLFQWENKSDNKTGLGLSCDSRALSQPKREDGCEFTGFSIDSEDSNNVAENCGGGPVKIDKNLPVLPYGATWKFGNFVCKSETAGVTCRNPHVGFLLSKFRQITF
jgi:hypothetical protein